MIQKLNWLFIKNCSMPTPHSNKKPISIPVIFEDNHVLAVCKPAGMLSQGDASGDENVLDRMKEYIRRKYKKPGNVFLGLVHRLDRNVGGVMLLARTSKAAARLSVQFHDRTIRKSYLARVEGKMPESHYVLTHYVLKDPEENKTTVFDAAADATSDARPGIAATISSAAKRATLEYKLMHFDGRDSLLDISLSSGRSHQIRAQLAHIGHPIIGDTKYGSKVAKGGRLELVARTLTFQHPTTKEMIQVEC